MLRQEQWRQSACGWSPCITCQAAPLLIVSSTKEDRQRPKQGLPEHWVWKRQRGSCPHLQIYGLGVGEAHGYRHQDRQGFHLLSYTSAHKTWGRASAVLAPDHVCHPSPGNSIETAPNVSEEQGVKLLYPHSGNREEYSTLAFVYPKWCLGVQEKFMLETDELHVRGIWIKGIFLVSFGLSKTFFSCCLLLKYY